VNHKRVERLMGLMGIHAIYPKKRLSISDKLHRIYPYLLKDLIITHPDHLWCSDIIYSNEKRLCLFNRCNGLVFKVCAFLEAIYNPGSGILYRSFE